jgi:hypothetical protein
MLMKTLLAILCVLVLAGTAMAQCPNAVGQWSTSDGTMMGGRASEAFCGVGGAPLVGGVPGNTQNAQSWSFGSALGTQWRAWGMYIDSNGAQLIGDTVDPGTGNGTRTYQTFYLGGQFWLDRNQGWADGLADLTGDLTTFQVITTLQIQGGQIAGAASNITFTGTFDNCAEANNCRVTFGITNAQMVWTPGMGTTMPTGYPPFLCGASTGELFEVCCITLQIDCTVETEPVSWSTMKAQYR